MRHAVPLAVRGILIFARQTLISTPRAGRPNAEPTAAE